MKLATLETLVELEQEMVRLGRQSEGQALREVLHLLARPDPELLTTGQAAQRLDVAIPTVKRWVERGALAGVRPVGRWLISAASVDRLLQLRATLREIEQEGLPSDDELQELIISPRRPAR
jgi:excisionase family DNA binding protein